MHVDTDKALIMKKHGFILLAIGLILMACDHKPSGDSATVTDEKSAAEAKGMLLVIDTAKSSVAFTGWGVGKNHPGKFKLKHGEFTVEENQITSGKFTVDIQSMHMDQQGEMFQGKLRTHLLSADFFEADKYPEAYFEITSVSPYSAKGNDTSVVSGANTMIAGNFTLKGTTKNVSFPANVTIGEDKVTAKADFQIDRTQWNMNYGADKEAAKDKFISPDVNIRLDIVGYKSDKEVTRK